MRVDDPHWQAEADDGERETDRPGSEPLSRRSGRRALDFAGGGQYRDRQETSATNKGRGEEDQRGERKASEVLRGGVQEPLFRKGSGRARTTKSNFYSPTYKDARTRQPTFELLKGKDTEGDC